LAVAEPLRRRFRLSVALPASLLSEVRSLRDKTVKAGFVGRALAVFRVDDVFVYRDLYGLRYQDREASLLATLLSYMETPQYLRKRLFPLSKPLSYAGLLPPLRTPHHPTASRSDMVEDGEFREGVVVSCRGSFSLVDVGLEKPIKVHKRLRPGLRVTVRLSKKDGSVYGEHVSRIVPRLYWGYRVIDFDKPLGVLVKTCGDALVIATSKYGDSIVDVSERLAQSLRRSSRVLVLFGSPREGLRDILSREGLELSRVTDYVVNTIPHQGTETVRTEEALYATLAILNLLAP